MDKLQEALDQFDWYIEEHAETREEYNEHVLILEEAQEQLEIIRSLLESIYCAGELEERHKERLERLLFGK